MRELNIISLIINSWKGKKWQVTTPYIESEDPQIHVPKRSGSRSLKIHCHQSGNDKHTFSGLKGSLVSASFHVNLLYNFEVTMTSIKLVSKHGGKCHMPLFFSIFLFFNDSLSIHLSYSSFTSPIFSSFFCSPTCNTIVRKDTIIT